MTSDISELLREGYQLKARMAADKERLAQINAAIAGMATFSGACKTARLAASGYVAKVQRKETVTWDQKLLYKAVSRMGVEEFKKAFTFEYKPKSSKELKDYMAAPDTPDEYRKLIDAARTVKEGAPSVTFEFVEAE